MSSSFRLRPSRRREPLPSIDRPRVAAGLLCLTVVASNGCSDPPDATASNVGSHGADGGVADDGDAATDGSCVPRTCAQVGATCGEVLEPCGTVLSCGFCPEGQTCGAQVANTCGYGTCDPKTCVQLGVACGLANDGCGSVVSCGSCPPGSECSPAGQCEAECPSWKVVTGDQLRAVVVGPSGKLFVGGEKHEGGWVEALSACSGETEKTRRVAPPGSSWSRLTALAVSGDAVYGVGHVKTSEGSTSDVLAARLDTSILAGHWIWALQASSGADEGWGVDVAEDGSVWSVGMKGGGDTRAWVGLLQPVDGELCSFEVTSGPGRGRAVAAGSGGVFVAGESGGGAFVKRYEVPSGEPDQTCGCGEAWEVSFPDLGSPAEVRALAYHDDAVYAGGLAQKDQTGGDQQLRHGQDRVEVQLRVGSACATKGWARGKPKAIEDLGDRRLLSDRGDEPKCSAAPRAFESTYVEGSLVILHLLQWMRFS